MCTNQSLCFLITSVQVDNRATIKSNHSELSAPILLTGVCMFVHACCKCSLTHTDPHVNAYMRVCTRHGRVMRVVWWREPGQIIFLGKVFRWPPPVTASTYTTRILIKCWLHKKAASAAVTAAYMGALMRQDRFVAAAVATSSDV